MYGLRCTYTWYGTDIQYTMLNAICMDMLTLGYMGDVT